jgi:hypothetical protein
VGLLYDVATRVVNHLHARASGAHPITAVLDRERAHLQPALDAVNRRLAEGHSLQPEEAVHVVALLEPYQSPEGSMRWGEQWGVSLSGLADVSGRRIPL